MATDTNKLDFATAINRLEEINGWFQHEDLNLDEGLGHSNAHISGVSRVTDSHQCIYRRRRNGDKLYCRDQSRKAHRNHDKLALIAPSHNLRSSFPNPLKKFLPLILALFIGILYF